MVCYHWTASSPQARDQAVFHFFHILFVAMKLITKCLFLPYTSEGNEDLNERRDPQRKQGIQDQRSSHQQKRHGSIHRVPNETIGSCLNHSVGSIVLNPHTNRQKWILTKDEKHANPKHHIQHTTDELDWKRKGRRPFIMNYIEANEW